jgi:ATP-dependent 26S proteasome regulatory subunit
MQVKDSHDRFANIEIDYLLQRIEQFDGIAILATNRRNDLDSAFLRRLRFVVDFVSPGVRERQILWEKSLPEHAPNGEQIRGILDLDQLARDLEVTGAQIKAISLGAAFLARDKSRPIEMEDIERAAEREYGKQGHLIHAPIGKITRLR